MNTLQNYRDRLESCGFSDAESLRIVKDFLKEYHRETELVEFIEQQEKDRFYVDRVQPEPNRQACRGLCGTGGCKGAGCGVGNCVCHDNQRRLCNG